MKMKSIFVLQHSYGLSGTGEDTKFIGVYSSRETAEEAIKRLSKQPGVKDLQDCFHIEEYEIDQDHWTEGFATETNAPNWSVWRQDDNGNVALVDSGLSENDALKRMREFERKGHKQTYWARENKKGLRENRFDSHLE